MMNSQVLSKFAEISCLLRLTRNINKANVSKSFPRMFSVESEDINVAKGPEKMGTPVLTGERSVNNVTLIGRLGKTPELRGTEERPVVLFSLATSFSLKSSDGEYLQKTDWHRIAIFRTGIRNWALNSLKKGDRVYVSGSLRYGTFLDSVTNKQVKAVSIVADDVVTLMKGPGDRDSPIDKEEELLED